MAIIPNNKITIEVAYAPSADQQTVLTVNVDTDSTVNTAITASGMLSCHLQIDLACHKVGIFSQLVRLDHIVQAGDRIEIYRELIVDPKTARRQRAATNNSK